MEQAVHFHGWRFALGCALPVLGAVNVVLQPGQAALGSFVIWASIAALEAAWPRTHRSPPADGARPALLWWLRLFVPLQMLLLAVGLRAAVAADWATVAGLAFAIGFVTGAQGITYAHELGHSRSRADRALAWLLMASVNYPQFMVEHYRGHHVRAATDLDPASARAGESLWRFLPRTLAGNLTGAWRLEAERLRVHRRPWLRSPLAWATAGNLALLAAIGMLGGWRGVAFWVGQSVFAVWLLETVNYIEHYGLRRRLQADGRPEPFGPRHAWNTDHAISNALLANLQRHSDHHMHAWKPFPELATLPETPRLPTGYAGCLLIAAIPAWWFRVMDPRLAAVEK